MRAFVLACALIACSFSLGSCAATMGKAMPEAINGEIAARAESGAVLGAPVAGLSLSGGGGGQFGARMDVPAPATKGVMSGGAETLARASAGTASASPKPAANRKIVYTGTLSLLVANKISGREEIDRVVKQYDGIIANATLDEVTFRVAPDRFDAAMEDLAKIGEVAAREIRSEDVTAQYFDLNLRIEVAEGSRQRLMEILKKAGAVKDVLEVERDIRRLTEEIEQLKGQMRLMQDRIDLATITVRLQEKQIVIQPRRYTLGNVFAWMNAVGLDRVLGTIPSNAPLNGGPWLGRALFGRPFTLATGSKSPLPEGFLPVLNNGQMLVGVTPQDHRMRVLYLKLRQAGALSFWTEALANEFKDQRGYIVRANEEFKLDHAGLRGAVLRCETAVGAEAWAYDVWLIQPAKASKKMVVVEYVRRKTAPENQLAAIEQAIKGIQMD